MYMYMYIGALFLFLRAEGGKARHFIPALDEAAA